MPIPQIETQRLRLRGWQETDLDAFAELNANPDFVRYLGQNEPISRFDSWKTLAMLTGHWALKGFGIWVVEDKNSGEFLGRVGIWQPDGWPGIEVGWGIAPKHWGKGYAKEAAQASIDWGFKNLNTPTLISVIHPDNHASKSVAKKVGETFSHHQEVMGKPSEIYQISAQEHAAAMQ